MNKRYFVFFDNLGTKCRKNVFCGSKTCICRKNVVILRRKTQNNTNMSTFTLNIPAEQVGWFEQMVRTMGWTFSKKETVSAAERRTRKAIEELENGEGTVCQSFEDYLKAIA